MTKESGSKNKGKTFVKEVLRQLDGRKCFKCQGYGHFQADCPNRRVLTLKEMEEIDCLASELVEEEEEEEETTTVLTPDVGELLVLQRILHANEGMREENQRDHIFHSRCNIQGKVCSLIIDGVVVLTLPQLIWSASLAYPPFHTPALFLTMAQKG